MPKPTAHSTMKEMKDYIRSKKLNKAPVRLGMRRPQMIEALKKIGHWDPRHDGHPKIHKSKIKKIKKSVQADAPTGPVSKDQFMSALAGLRSI